MAMNYREYWQQHKELSSQVEAWEQQRDVAQGAYDRAAAEFDSQYSTATFEEKNALLDKLGNTGEALSSATTGLQAAQNKLETLELDNPKLEQDRQDGKEPGKTLHEKVEGVIDTAMAIGAAANIYAATVNPEIPHVPPTTPEVHRVPDPVNIDQKLADTVPGPRDQRDDMNRRMSAVDDVNKAYDNATAGPASAPQGPPPETSMTYQASATFGTQEFGTHTISADQIGRDFAAPPPPPPPPPPEKPSLSAEFNEAAGPRL